MMAAAAAAASPSSTSSTSSSPFTAEWTCSSEYIRSGTPSRRDGISYHQELQHRIKGTSFIRQTVSSLKLKPICKETAYVYFHRFFMLRSFKHCDPCRLGSACVYLASKYEDHPAYKEHLVRIFMLLTKHRDLDKKDKEYEEVCDRLIRDENQLLQVLGFDGLAVRHFQVLIVESSSQTPISGFSKAMYSNAYKIASEINRLTMLCVQYPSHILACVAIFLSSLYHGTDLPDGWTNRVKGAVAEDVHLVVKLGNEIKERMARESDLVKNLLTENKVVFPPPPPQQPQPQPPKQQQQQQHSAKPQPQQHQHQQQNYPNHHHQSSQQQQQNHHHQQSSQHHHQQKRPHNVMMNSSSSSTASTNASFAQFNGHSNNSNGYHHYYQNGNNNSNNNCSSSGGSSTMNQHFSSNRQAITSSYHHQFPTANIYSSVQQQQQSAPNCSHQGSLVNGSTPTVSFNKQILSTFSPDSAYSSNSSHSPPEKKRKKQYT